MVGMRIFVYRSTSTFKWLWELRTARGQVIARCHQPLATKRNALRSADRFLAATGVTASIVTS